MDLHHAQSYRWTVEKYEELAEKGVFQRKEPVELIDGKIVMMHRSGWHHDYVINSLLNAIAPQTAERFLVAPYLPFNLDAYSQPHPDLHLFDDVCFQHRRLPNPSEVYLVVEVSDHTLLYDRETKAPLYATYEVREYWLVNLERKEVEVYREPLHGKYRVQTICSAHEKLAPSAFPDIEIELRPLFLTEACESFTAKSGSLLG